MQWWVFTCVFRVSAKYLWTRFQPLGRHMIIPAGKEFWAAKGLRFLHPNFLELETYLLPLTMPDSSVTCIGQYDVPLCICLVSPKILLFVRCVNTLKHCFTPTYMANEWMINPDPHMFHPPPIGANNGVAYICAGGNGGPIAINNYKMCLFQNDAHHFWQYLVLPCKKVKFPHCMSLPSPSSSTDPRQHTLCGGDLWHSKNAKQTNYMIEINIEILKFHSPSVCAN